MFLQLQVKKKKVKNKKYVLTAGRFRSLFYYLIYIEQ